MVSDILHCVSGALIRVYNGSKRREDMGSILGGFMEPCLLLPVENIILLCNNHVFTV